MTLHYDYSASKAYCDQIGIFWLGDDYAGLIDADKDASEMGLTQEQVDALLRKHLWQVKTLFTPSNYRPMSRIMMAMYFLTGWKPK